MMSRVKLNEELENALKYADIEIPSYIKDNLNKELREYQIQALKRFLLQRKKPSINHLMFNMATGSGKTLVMAALMLDCYKNGYRNFIFFVNSTSIVEKTKANFCDSSSSKYLFASEINIDGIRVAVRSIDNFNESDENSINIYFSTIQGLFSLFKDEKENSLTLEDLQNYKIVFLADEAHHLNSETKRKLNKSEEEDKENWESIMKKAFKSHDDNLMLEFTATLPNERSVLEKYEDKIIYKYALEEFCKNGYSKRIFLVKYDNTELKARFIGACLLSSYRELLARENNIELKPVVLFKSENIKLSHENQKLFNETLQELNSDDIIEFYNNVDKSDELFKYSIDFFKSNFKESYASILAKHIKIAFKDIYQLNANDEKEIKEYQIKLNTLEDKENTIRVIFAVDKLNEGWDVLNLFDIVRLGSATAKSTARTTTKEAQLIGRGARYFPFGQGKEKYKRKYDGKFNELSMLERLSYHALNDVEYIRNIRNELRVQGSLLDDNIGILELKPSKKAKEIIKNNEIYYVSNEKRILGKNSLFSNENIQRKLEKLEIPYIGHSISNIEEKFDDENSKNSNFICCYEIGENIGYNIFAKAMNILKIDINKIKIYNKNILSKREFYDKVISFLNLKFNRKQTFKDPAIKLEIAKYILTHYKDALDKEIKDFEVSEFKIKKLENTGSRKVVKNIVNKDYKSVFDMVEDSPYEWLYYDKYSTDSELEREFLDFIDANKERIDNKFSQWIVIRNEGFEEFKIYDNRKTKSSYGDGFEPDFILFGKPKDSEDLTYLSAEMILESKGSHIYDIDRWKEDLIVDEINKKIFTINKDNTKKELNIYALPFFFGDKYDKNDNNKKFKDQFYNFFKVKD